MKILWEPGKGFAVSLKSTEKLQPNTFITYFPALPYWDADHSREPLRQSSF